MSRDERALVTGLSDPAVPPAMATGDLEILGLLPRSSNYTVLARAGDGDDAVLVVYKPRRGEILDRYKAEIMATGEGVHAY